MRGRGRRQDATPGGRNSSNSSATDSSRYTSGGESGAGRLELGRFVHGCGDPPGKLGARSDAKLAVDVGEVRLDRADAHEELGRDLLVGAAAGGEFGHPPLGLGQLVGRGSAAADPPELRASPLRPEPCAQLLEDRERLLERLARRLLLLRLPAYAPRQSSVRPRSSGNGSASASERSNAVMRGRQIALGGEEQAAATGRPGEGLRAPESLRVGLVRLEVGTGQLELAERDQRLDASAQTGRVGSCIPPARGARGVAQVVAGGLQVAELRARAGPGRRA